MNEPLPRNNMTLSRDKDQINEPPSPCWPKSTCSPKVRCRFGPYYRRDSRQQNIAKRRHSSPSQPPTHAMMVGRKESTSRHHCQLLERSHQSIKCRFSPDHIRLAALARTSYKSPLRIRWRLEPSSTQTHTIRPLQVNAHHHNNAQSLPIYAPEGWPHNHWVWNGDHQQNWRTPPGNRHQLRQILLENLPCECPFSKEDCFTMFRNNGPPTRSPSSGSTSGQQIWALVSSIWILTSQLTTSASSMHMMDFHLQVCLAACAFPPRWSTSPTSTIAFPPLLATTSSPVLTASGHCCSPRDTLMTCPPQDCSFSFPPLGACFLFFILLYEFVPG